MTKALKLNMQLPATSLDAYLSKINHFPLLSASQEQTLAIQWYDNGDLNAARELVSSHLRFVVHVAKSYKGYGLPFADLIQEGNVGLMKAVKRFDPYQGVRLVTFAIHWIKSEICDFVIRNWRLVKIATTKAQRKLFFNLRRKKEHLQCLTSTEADSIAKELGVNQKEVFEMEKRLFHKEDPSYNTLENYDEDNNLTLKINDTQTDETTTTFDDPAHLLMQQENQKIYPLEQAIQQLDQRSQAIVKNRWLSDKKMTLQELAKEYKISIERIRQIEKVALQQMKQYLI